MNWITWTNNKFFPNDNCIQECFICYSNGKTPDEEIREIFIKKRGLNYPLVSLSHAYNCNCVGLFAHNKCLLKINKCPTCRKFISKPNLYVETLFDYLFGLIFAIVKKNPIVIFYIKNICTITSIGTFILCYLIENNYCQIEKKIIEIIICKLLIIINFLGGFIFIMKDYFTKYWLYDESDIKIHSL